MFRRVARFTSSCWPRRARAPTAQVASEGVLGPNPLHALTAATLQSLKADAKEGRAVRFGLYVRDQPCKVVKVYDGDSVTIAWAVPQSFQLCFANARLAGIDTPELRGTKGSEREDAEVCRDRMAALALHQLFIFTTEGATGLDKYARPLVVLRARRGWTAPEVCDALEPHGGSLNDWALAALPGCLPYSGGTKARREGNP